jgi:hypothetical protein
MPKINKWKLIESYPVKKYNCGLAAGQKVRLIKDIIVKDHSGDPTGLTPKVGEIWEVISGASELPIDVWLRQPDGKRHTWDDDASIFEYFEVVGK